MLSFIKANPSRGKEILAATLAIVAMLFVKPARGETLADKINDQPVSHAKLVGNDSANSRRGWTIRVGAGALYAPAFAGARDYQVMVFPSLKADYKDIFFASVKDGVGYNIIHSGGLRAGPLVKYEFGRKEDGNNPFRVGGAKSVALKGFGNVDGTLECGGFAAYTYDSFTYKIELLQGVGGHGGVTGEASINYTGIIRQNGPPLFYAFGPRAKFADSKYINAYYGINQTQSINSGLGSYSPGGGIVSYGVGGFMSMPLYGPVSAALFGGYDRLGSEVSSSPFIKKHGSDNQFAAGLTVTYRFEL